VESFFFILYQNEKRCIKPFAGKAAQVADLHGTDGLVISALASELVSSSDGKVACPDTRGGS
jgi:hypothetical protein